MKEHTAVNIGVNTKQAQLITYDIEEILWQKGVLGVSTPDQLRDTVQFLPGFNFFLRAVQEHYYLQRWTPTHQLHRSLLKKNYKGQRCMLYREDACTKTTIFCLQIVSVILHHRVNVTSFTRKLNCHKCAIK